MSCSLFQQSVRLVDLTGGPQLHDGVLADGVEHAVPRFTGSLLGLSQKALVNEGCDPLEDLSVQFSVAPADGLRCFEGEAAAEDSQTTEQTLSVDFRRRP